MNKSNEKPIVLVVDDEKSVLNAIKMMLECEGFSVFEADCGDVALIKLKDFKPDIILLDIDMPKMDGFEVCRVIKEDSETKNIPVIFLTGAGSQMQMKLQSLMVGAVDYISKPYDWEDLIYKIRMHMLKNRKGSLQ